jgi:hypothetical protein
VSVWRSGGLEGKWVGYDVFESQVCTYLLAGVSRVYPAKCEVKRNGAGERELMYLLAFVGSNRPTSRTVGLCVITACLVLVYMCHFHLPKLWDPCTDELVGAGHDAIQISSMHFSSPFVACHVMAIYFLDLQAQTQHRIRSD